MKQLEDDSGVPCDMRIPPLVNGKIHKRIVQQAYVVRDEDSADGQHEETGRYRDEDVQIGQTVREWWQQSFNSKWPKL